MDIRNMYDKAQLIADWLSYQTDNLGYGLKSVADAEKLYDYWVQRDD